MRKPLFSDVRGSKGFNQGSLVVVTILQCRLFLDTGKVLYYISIYFKFYGKSNKLWIWNFIQFYSKSFQLL